MLEEMELTIQRGDEDEVTVTVQYTTEQGSELDGFCTTYQYEGYTSCKDDPEWLNEDLVQEFFNNN